MVTIRRATANMLVTLPNTRVRLRLQRLTDVAHVLALQEWPRSRDVLLREHGRAVLWPRRTPVETGNREAWTFHRSRLGGGPIGVYDLLDETALSCKAKALAGPGVVGRIPGRRSVLGPSWCTRLKSRRPDGTIVVRYDIHLTAGVQVGDRGYRHDAASQARVVRHRNERDRLERLVERDLAKGHVVEVYGDTNYHQMEIPGLIGWWVIDRTTGTFGHRAIDGVWTSEAPDDVRFLPPLVPGEHRHVITHTKENAR